MHYLLLELEKKTLIKKFKPKCKIRSRENMDWTDEGVRWEGEEGLRKKGDYKDLKKKKKFSLLSIVQNKT